MCAYLNKVVIPEMSHFSSMINQDLGATKLSIIAPSGGGMSDIEY